MTASDHRIHCVHLSVTTVKGPPKQHPHFWDLKVIRNGTCTNRLGTRAMFVGMGWEKTHGNGTVKAFPYRTLLRSVLIQLVDPFIT